MTKVRPGVPLGANRMVKHSKERDRRIGPGTGRLDPQALTGSRAEPGVNHHHRHRRADRVREREVHGGDRLLGRRGHRREPAHSEVGTNASPSLSRDVAGPQRGEGLARRVPQPQEGGRALLGAGLHLAGLRRLGYRARRLRIDQPLQQRGSATGAAPRRRAPAARTRNPRSRPRERTPTPPAEGQVVVPT